VQQWARGKKEQSQRKKRWKTIRKSIPLEIILAISPVTEKTRMAFAEDFCAASSAERAIAALIWDGSFKSTTLGRLCGGK
jgi:hypothetical protein